ncbi:hypothetical protein [Nonomuraea roseoviolacea]|uniref:hypothetical protein n=1 Tax=Nonomuraea roseoviolacea TaxID=103837 RepID=UPI0031D466BD
MLYRFHGLSGVLLTVTGPDAPAGKTLSVSYLTDGDDYIVLASGTETDELTALRTATCATAEFSPNRHVPIDITTLSDDAERASLGRGRTRAIDHGVIGNTGLLTVGTGRA